MAQRASSAPPPTFRWWGPAVWWGLALILLLRYPVNTARLSSDPYLMDFNVYHRVAQRVVAGDAANLYAPTTAGSVMMVFKYAPAWAAVWMPLGWLSVRQGAVLWHLLSVAALLVMLATGMALCRRAQIPVHPLVMAATVLLLTRPLAEEMGNGQVNALWGALTLGGVLAVSRRRPWPAALAFAASILLKLPSLVFLAYFVLRRQWGLLGRTLACLAAGALAGSWLLLPRHPWQLLSDWMQAMRTSGTTYAFEIGNQSLLAWLARFLTRDPYHLNVAELPQAALPWIGLALLGGLLWLIAQPPRPDAQALARRWLYDSALLTILMVIFSPSAWVATYLALAWPILLALASLPWPGCPRWGDRWAQLFIGLTVIAGFWTTRKPWKLLGLTSWHGEGYLFLAFMVLPWMALLLMAGLWRQRQALLRPTP